MNRFISRIEREAENAARVITVDPERVKAFKAGAVFAIEMLSRSLEIHPQEGENGTAYLEQLRLEDVRLAIHTLRKGVPLPEFLKCPMHGVGGCACG